MIISINHKSMIYLLVSFSIFFVFTLFHIILHRILVKKGILTMKTALIFIPGLLADTYIIYQLNGIFGNLTDYLSVSTMWLIPIPLSAILFYILLTAILVIFYTHPAMNYVSPSTVILRILEKKKMTHKELMSHFSDKMLISDRLKNLQESGLINLRSDRLRASPHGAQIALFREYYRKIFGWSSED